MIIDFDKVDRLEDLKARVQCDPDVFFSFVSPSGNGLKVAYRFDKAITDPNEFTSIYKYYLGVFFGRYGVEPDKSTKDASRACFFSSDPELYCNPDARLLLTSVADHQPSINLAAVGAHVKDEDAALVPAAIEHLRKSKLGYQDWFRCGLALATLGEDGRAHFRDLSINDHYRDSEAAINAEYDECLRNASGSIQLSTLFHIAKGHGFSHAAPVVTPGRFEDFVHELSDQFALADTRDPNLLLGLELQTVLKLPTPTLPFFTAREANLTTLF